MVKSVLGISLGQIGLNMELYNGTAVDVPLARYYGEVTDVRTDRKGNVTLMGDCRAINAQTGEEFKSSVVNFPRGLQEKVIVAMDNAANMVRYAFDIWATPDPKGKSYGIGFKDLLEKEDAPDPLANFSAGLPPMTPVASAKK